MVRTPKYMDKVKHTVEKSEEFFIHFMGDPLSFYHVFVNALVVLLLQDIPVSIRAIKLIHCMEILFDFPLHEMSSRKY